MARLAGRRWVRRLGDGSGERGQSGQASVELVGVLPLLLLLALGAGQLLAAGQARELAGHAARAGAVGLLQGTDPDRAARAALSSDHAARLRVTVDGRRVAVRLRPASVLPGLAGLLVADAAADAGPAG